MRPNPNVIEDPVLRIFEQKAAALARAMSEEAAERVLDCRARLDADIGNVALRLELALMYEEGHNLRAAITLLEEGTILPSSTPDLFWRLMHCLNESGEADAARRLAASTSRRYPEDLRFRVGAALLLPVIYESELDIETWRSRFRVGLQELSHQVAFTDQRNELWMSAFAHWTNFYLAYQGRDDLDLQVEYGSIVHRIVSESHLAARGDQPNRSRVTGRNGAKIRIGFVSSKIYRHVVARMYLGWIKHLDRDQFQVFVYHAGRTVDSMTEEYQRSTDAYYREIDLALLAATIAADEIDVLVYLDLGMTPRLSQLACLRLAPCQCVSWGHPVTSGIPTIDYFLSGELIEPPKADAHYSEKLIRLPGFGLDYRNQLIARPFMLKTRQDFGIRSDSVVYLCCQSSFKYLPGYDLIIARIASEVRNSQFVFLSPNELLEAKMRSRISMAFSDCGLEFDHHALFLPYMTGFDYLQLYTQGDVFLDTFGFSSFNTVLDAVRCGLPIVTCRGEFMKACLASSVLLTMGLHETIATSEDEFVKIAVKLGNSPDQRRILAEEMKLPTRLQAVFDNKASVEALERFCKNTCTGKDE